MQLSITYKPFNTSDSKKSDLEQQQHEKGDNIRSETAPEGCGAGDGGEDKSQGTVDTVLCQREVDAHQAERTRLL